MRKLTMLSLLILVAITGCASALQKQSENITVTYEAITRGSNMKITAKQGSVEANSSRAEKTSVTKTISSEQWKELVDEVGKINLDKINRLKAPSDKRFYDGAMIASLTVQLKDTTYRSSSFDHGNPPAEIKALVDKVISLSGLDKDTE
jgi:hypothetical protein